MASACAQGGRALASPRTWDEIRTLGAVMAVANEQEAWLSMNDRAQEGVFSFEDGSALGDTLWGADQPDNDQGVEDCVEQLDFDQWNDGPCGRSHAAVCEAAVDEPGTCLSPHALVLVGQVGTTVGARRVSDNSGCFPFVDAWSFLPPSDGTLVIEVASPTDQAISIRETTCAGQPYEVRCVDARDAGELETTRIDAHAGVPLFVFVSPYDAGEVGPYTVTATRQPAACGDGAMNAGEGCDDSNDVPADGCTACARDSVLVESEPNDSGSPWLNVDNFSAAAAEGPVLINRTLTWATGAITPAGDEDVFLLQSA